jgi:hypothetical protein
MTHDEGDVLLSIVLLSFLYLVAGLFVCGIVVVVCREICDRTHQTEQRVIDESLSPNGIYE